MTRTTELNMARIIFAAAATLAAGGLAGCTEPADQDADIAGSTAQKANAPFEIVGVPFLYGDPPHKEGTAVQSARGIEFEPTFYAVVYLKFHQSAGLIAKHAYFPVSGTTDNVDCAIGYLISEREDSRCRPYPNPQGRTGPNSPPPASMGPIVRNFDGFGFGSQQTVYVFVDNTNVQFNETTPVSFTPFGAFEVPGQTGSEIKHPNWSFYDADVVNLGPGRRGLIMHNYYRGKDGGVISKAAPHANSATYSINFNLLLCRDGLTTCDFTNPAEVIPLAIDPDTGNGWGSKP